MVFWKKKRGPGWYIARKCGARMVYCKKMWGPDGILQEKVVPGWYFARKEGARMVFCNKKWCPDGFLQEKEWARMVF
jgi:hypothetical protein